MQFQKYLANLYKTHLITKPRNLQLKQKAPSIVEVKKIIMAKKTKKDPCWEGYEQAGTKKKEGKTVPNCIKTPKDKK